jgi:hypothetical protein
MANFPVLFKNALGKPENLMPSDGGIQIDVIDCENANSTVDLFSQVDNSGSLVLFSSWDGSAAVGTAGSTFAFGGSVTVATDMTVSGDTVLNGTVDLGNAAGDLVTVTGEVDSDITFENSGARAISVDSQALTIATTTAGILSLNGATEVEVNTLLLDVNSTGGVTIDAVTASQFVVSGGTDDLTLGARGGTITLNEAGQTTLNALFSASSVVGALNEVKTSNLGTTTPSALASEIIAAGQVVYIDYDVGNTRPGIYIADNTVAGKQNPIGVAINGGNIGDPIYVATHGQEVVVNSVIAATNEGAPVYLTTTGGVTTTAPSGTGTGDTSQVIGTVSLSGGAGVAKVIVQIFESYVL